MSNYGQLIWNRSKLRIACWNVRTLLDLPVFNYSECRTALICRELSRYDLYIVALLETKFPDDEKQVELELGYTVFYNCPPANLHRKSGVGFTMKTRFVANLEELPHGFSDRIMT